MITIFRLRVIKNIFNGEKTDKIQRLPRLSRFLDERHVYLNYSAGLRLSVIFHEARVLRAASRDDARLASTHRITETKKQRKTKKKDVVDDASAVYQHGWAVPRRAMPRAAIGRPRSSRYTYRRVARESASERTMRGCGNSKFHLDIAKEKFTRKTNSRHRRAPNRVEQVQ